MNYITHGSRKRFRVSSKASATFIFALIAGVLALVFLLLVHSCRAEASEKENPTIPEQQPVVVAQSEYMHSWVSVRYALMAGEREMIEAAVMAEAEGESVEGQMLVAQCILNACLRDNIRPGEVLARYGYATTSREPSKAVCEAVTAVFSRGETVTDAPILFFYSPANMPGGVSEWHESLDFVIEEGGHRFFKEWTAK